MLGYTNANPQQSHPDERRNPVNKAEKACKQKINKHLSASALMMCEGWGWSAGPTYQFLSQKSICCVMTRKQDIYAFTQTEQRRTGPQTDTDTRTDTATPLLARSYTARVSTSHWTSQIRIAGFTMMTLRMPFPSRSSWRMSASQNYSWKLVQD